jgi:hypothetical protein
MPRGAASEPKTEHGPRYSHGAFAYVGDDLLSHTLSRCVLRKRFQRLSHAAHPKL